MIQFSRLIPLDFPGPMKSVPLMPFALPLMHSSGVWSMKMARNALWNFEVEGLRHGVMALTRPSRLRMMMCYDFHVFILSFGFCFCFGKKVKFPPARLRRQKPRRENQRPAEISFGR